MVAKNGKPRGRLAALAADAGKPRPFGPYRGRIRCSENLGAPWPEDIRRALEG